MQSVNNIKRIGNRCNLKKTFRKRFELAVFYRSMETATRRLRERKRKKKKEANCSIGKRLRSILQETKPYVRKRLVDRIVRPNCLFDLIPLVMQPTSVSLCRIVSWLEYSIVIGRNSSVIRVTILIRTRIIIIIVRIKIEFLCFIIHEFSPYRNHLE